MADRCLFCGTIIPEGRQICPNCEKDKTLLGYGKKSRLLQVMLVVEHAIKRRWKWIFGKGGKK
jgi:predicted nucleic acid-binding Zn ribbon protein